MWGTRNKIEWVPRLNNKQSSKRNKRRKVDNHNKNGYNYWALVAHTCNPSYSGGRNQEDHSSKPAQANNSRDPISKNPSHTHTHTK
jgi:hypothetical protein